VSTYGESESIPNKKEETARREQLAEPTGGKADPGGDPRQKG
jgi:hypothetical protein